MKLSTVLPLVMLLLGNPATTFCQSQNPVPIRAEQATVTVSELVTVLRQKAKGLENTSGMRTGFVSLMAAHQLPADSVRYSDYVLVRLLYEATRDAGFWNMHWNITDQPPNSDNVWRQWAKVGVPSVVRSTATAECDELSALYAFLARRAGLTGIGLFWPTANHTVAVWTLHPKTGAVVRVVVPTSQIFLEQTDDFDTRKFDPWKQKTIYDYTRRDVANSFEIPKPLADFFLQQVDKYAGASDGTLQRLRYVREAVFRNSWSPEQAAQDALIRKAQLPNISAEDSVALQHFADDMRAQAPRR